jgi:sugar porter (SP) family MFS transporter
MKLNGLLVKSTIVAGLGGLLFGFDTAVISGATSALTNLFHLSPTLLGITVASALWGTVVGAMVAGILGDRYGRRDSLRVIALWYVVSALGCAAAWNWNALLVFRFIGGLAIGGSSVLGPMYIAEIAPAKVRGRLVGFFQINVVVGILLAYLSNYLIALQHLGAAEWRWSLGVAALPAVFFFLMLFTIPRSPRWLVKRGYIAEARSVLQLTGDENYQRDLQEILDSVNVEQQQKAEKLFSPKYAYPIFLAISIGMFNQLSGINALLYYLNDIFSFAGFSKISGNLQAVVVGVTLLVFTLVAMAVIDSLGRKTLLLIGSVGTAVSLAGVAGVFFTGHHRDMLLWLLVSFIAFFSISQGAVIWVYISEVFPNVVRAKGQSLGAFSHWFMNAVISAIFPIMAASSGAYPFVFFSFMMVVQFFVVLFFYPETKGYTLEEMQTRVAAAK